MELKKGKDKKGRQSTYTLMPLLSLNKQKKNLPAEMCTTSHEPQIPAPPLTATTTTSTLVCFLKLFNY